MVRTCTKRTYCGTYQPHPKCLYLVLGWGVIVSVRVASASCAHAPFSTATKLYARHRIEFCHVADKVHIVRPDGAHAHEKLGGDVEHREEHNREVVGHERGGGPVTREEDFPSTELGANGSVPGIGDAGRHERLGASQCSRYTQD